MNMNSLLSAWRRVVPLLSPDTAASGPSAAVEDGGDSSTAKKKSRATLLASIKEGSQKRRQNYNHLSQEDVEDKRLSFAIRNVYCVSGTCPLGVSNQGPALRLLLGRYVPTLISPLFCLFATSCILLMWMTGPAVCHAARHDSASRVFDFVLRKYRG
jgi:hypothetical protein